jgi:trehalose 6-phosphate synthase
LARRVIDGMLGADLVGFHTGAWAGGFLDRCEELGAAVDRSAGEVVHGRRRSWIRTYPIPIDTGDLRARAEKEASVAWAARLRTGWTHGDPGAGSLVVRADRTEPSKNIVRGFEAFGLLLDRRSDLAASARFAACLYPSRQSMPEYQRYTAQIKETVETVNRRHPGSIRLYLEDDFDRTLGALTTYDVLLVNPIMDGMNLVSKEGPALNRMDGVLVLSRGAGSFGELGEHTVEIADALDVEATAAALERALDMDPTERARRTASLRAVVEERRPADWIDAQLRDLAAIQRGDEPLTHSAT